jgi:tetratricopeptide (TPR) repeat protein
MTHDMCPFISKDYKFKTCPGCKIKKSQVTGSKDDIIMGKCLDILRVNIDGMRNKGNLEKIVTLELYKLKRITTMEEETQKLDVIVKKKVKEALGLIQDIDYKMNKKEQLQYNLYVGDVEFNLGNYDKAQILYNSANTLDPRDKRSWNNIGVTMVRQGRIKDALGFYDKALELDPEFGGAWFNKGKALFKLGVEKKALECFKKATRYSPENKSAWNNLGVTLRHMRKFKDSIKCYDQAIKIHSDYPWAWHNKGVALLELKRYKAAMECFEKALRIDPDYAPAKESKRDVMRKLL